jgi:(2R)-3-sulfolactate dehydrogenase (NADP+)
MSAETLLSLAEIHDITASALRACGADAGQAGPVSESVAQAELDGLRSHGLARLPAYCDHLRCGKVIGTARPTIAQLATAVLDIDAAHGFAHPAIALGLPALRDLAAEHGIAAAAVRRSYNCGVVGHHVAWLAEQSMVALAFVNAPASVAPAGGIRALFGTNPFAFAAPRDTSAPLVIDQSSSVVARGEILLKAQAGEPIPLGWAIDAEGRPTTDASAAMKGALLPAGGYKGSGMALAVEVLAAVLTGASLSMHASSFADNAGGPPGTGQFFIALDVRRFPGADSFAAQLEQMLGALAAQPGARLPGARRRETRERHQRDGVRVPAALLTRIAAYQ